MMTIADKFLENKRQERAQQEQKRREYAKNLGERVNKALLNPAFIQKVTPLLAERGSVEFSDVGCLCQDGCCSDKRGFTEYCKEAFTFWNREGVEVKLGVQSGLTVQDHHSFAFGSHPKVTLYSND